MEEAILNKTEEIIKLLDNNDNIKKLKVLKQKIDNDEEIKTLIDRSKRQEALYKKGKITNNEFLTIKKELYDNLLYREFHALELELSYLILYFEHRLSSLIDTRLCKKSY